MLPLTSMLLVYRFGGAFDEHHTRILCREEKNVFNDAQRSRPAFFTHPRVPSNFRYLNRILENTCCQTLTHFAFSIPRAHEFTGSIYTKSTSCRLAESAYLVPNSNSMQKRQRGLSTELLSE